MDERYIRMESAAVLAKSCKVTVIGMERVPFERVLGLEIGTALMKLHESNGINFKMQAMCERLEPNG